MKTTIQQRNNKLANRLLNKFLKRANKSKIYGQNELKAIDIGVKQEDRIDEEKELKIREEAYKDKFFKEIIYEEKHPKRKKAFKRRYNSKEVL